MNLRSRVQVGIGWTAIGVGVRTLAYGLQTVFLARILGPRAYGVAAMVLMIIGLVQTFGDAGVSGALIHANELPKRTLSTLYWLNVVLGVVLFGASIPVGILAAFVFQESALLNLIPAAGFVFLVGGWGKQFEALLQRELEFQRLAIIDSSSGIIAAAITATLALVGRGVWAIVIGLVAEAAIRSGHLVVIGLRRWRPGREIDFRAARPLIGFGVYQLGDRLLNYCAFRVDQLVVGAMVGPEALGYYSFASNLVIQPQARINPIISRVAFPVFARIQDDVDRLRRGYLEVSEKLAAINMPILMGMAAVAPVAVPLVFGERWTPAIALVQVLCFYAAIRSTGNPIGNLVLARGRADLSFFWNLILLPLVGMAVYSGGRISGLLGIGCGLVMLQLFLSVLNYLFLVRSLIGSCAGSYVRALGIPFLMSVVMALGVWKVQILIGTKDYRSLAAQIAVGVSMYGAAVFACQRRLFDDVVSIVRSFHWRILRGV